MVGKCRTPEQLLPQRLDDPFRHAVALWLAHEGVRTFYPEEFDLVLKVIGEVVGTAVVAEDQTGRDVFRHTAPKCFATPCSIGLRASQRLALEEAWVPISSPERWLTAMKTKARPSRRMATAG